MDRDEAETSGTVNIVDEVESRSLPRTAVNSVILDYYKKFGRKRDLEQYFSLSTAQGEITDPSGVFWRKMKSQTDSSDSAEGKSESSQEVCRISIKCSAPQPSSSQDDDPQSKTESDSPPIITEDLAPVTRHSDNESVKSDDNNSQRSLDVLLDTSLNKLHSPSSSITSQRKLEWDSLADVGYGNESDRKTSASSLSTLERLALNQQYSNNDTKQALGPPTAHSTPLDENDNKSKGKKSTKKTTKIYQKDVDFVEVNVPHSSDPQTSQAINVNLTKHISFNVDRDGAFLQNIKKDLSVSPEKSVEIIPQVHQDKEIQTSLTKSKEFVSTSADGPSIAPVNIRRVPILINVNTLKKKNRRRKLRAAKRTLRNKRKIDVQRRTNQPETHIEQVSEAESFEYMPGHIYNQKQMKVNQSRSNNTAGNKSSLESSGALTTESSKDSKHSFTKDLEKSIKILTHALQQRVDDSNLRRKLVKELVQKLLQSRYRDDDSTTDFLSNLSYSSKKLGLAEGNHTSSSTSDGNTDKPLTKPKKSILRGDRFNPSIIASTSQSAPNLPSATCSEKPVISLLAKKITSSNTESDSSKEKTSSDNVPIKVSSEELYQKYLEALKREDAYKRHLKDKEIFLKQKLVSSDSVVAPRPVKSVNRLKDLMKDLTRNNYDDGSGDASKLEGGSSSNLNMERYSALKSQRSHSVFTFSSGQSESQAKKPNLKKRLQSDIKDMAGSSKDGAYHYCCCPYHSSNAKVGVSDSSVQVNLKSCDARNTQERDVELVNAGPYQASNTECRRNFPHIVPDNLTGDIKYVCLCNNKSTVSRDHQDSFFIYKCSRLTNRGVQLEDRDVEDEKLRTQNLSNNPSTSKGQALPKPIVKRDSFCSINTHELKRSSKSSQTNLAIKMLCQKSSNKSITTSSSSEGNKNIGIRRNGPANSGNDLQIIICEGTRCVQTEISINPRISDPCLSDITIISDIDCVQLISEQYKKVFSKPNIEAADSRSIHTQSDDDVYSGTGFDVNFNEPTDDFNTRVVNKNIQSDFGENNPTDVNSDNAPYYNDNEVDNYKIPIQGTNMMLLVSLGAQESKPENKNGKVVSQNVVTDKPALANQSTSLTEECSKGVQSQSTDIFPIISKISGSIDKVGRSRNSSMKDSHLVIDKKITPYFESPRIATTLKQDDQNLVPEKKSSPPFKSSRLVTTCLVQDEPKFSTYPKPDDSKLLRTNTDIGRYEDKNCCVQTDDINKKEVETQLNQFSQPSSTTTASDISKQSKCDCEKNAECNNICQHTCSKRGERIESITKETDVVSKRECGVQKDFIDEELPQNILTAKGDLGKTSGSVMQGYYKGSCDKKVTDYEELQHLTRKPLLRQNALETKDMTEKSSSDNQSNVAYVEHLQAKIIPETSTDSMKDNVLIKDPILTMIHDITKRYSKNEVEKNKRKKCFKEIMTVLNYLLDTDESTDPEEKAKNSGSVDTLTENKNAAEKKLESPQPKKLVDKGVQLSSKKYRLDSKTSTDLPISTDIPSTSSDSATCKVLNKIKRECEKYHQKRCKSKNYDNSSSTSVHCEKCKRVHACPCKSHRCKSHKSRSAEKIQKKCVAYNLIIQTSESMVSEEKTSDKKHRALQNIIVKVPSKRKPENIPFKEMSAKIEKCQPTCSPRSTKSHRSKSCPNESEVSSIDGGKNTQAYTVRDYLEKNRPDFVEKCSNRQNCLKFISEVRNDDPSATPHLKMVVVHTPTCMGNMGACNMYCGGVPMCYNSCIDPCDPYTQSVQNEVTRLGETNERAAQRDLLSVYVDRKQLRELTSDELRQFAQEVGHRLRHNRVASKFISEREMKKHSERIYKSLPEVVKKKEDKRKENVKKTNLLMASIFKRNLQRKTLRGAVNISNYSDIIKI